MAYFFPHIDNFWHAQGVFTLIERRMPLYIVFLCKHCEYVCIVRVVVDTQLECTQIPCSTIMPRGPCPR